MSLFFFKEERTSLEQENQEHEKEVYHLFSIVVIFHCLTNT